MIALLLLAACGSSSEDSGTSPEATTPSTGTTPTSATSTGTTPAPCTDDADADIPEGAEWITLHGNHSGTYSLADQILDGAWQGNHGTYDLNRVETEGANGFQLDRPGTVVGARAQWSNLGPHPEPAVLMVWPDFGSDGYMWDAEAPLATATRCLTEDNTGEWITHTLAEPIYIDQPHYVFAGYHRDEIPSVESSPTPEILFEAYWEKAEPYYAGIRLFGVDDSLYYLGLASTWYTWRVELAVIYDDELPAGDKPFQLDEALSASSRVAWGDYDNDGDDDLMTNGPTLYRNEGDGTFTDVTADLISAGTSTSGGLWADYDNDGCLDYFGWAESELLLWNDCLGSGAFTDVTEESGINDVQSEIDCNGDGEEEPSQTQAAGWADIDGDGWLDLYLANYECTSEYAYFENYDDRFWRNNGDGTFSDWTEKAGVPDTNEAGRGVTTGDPDRDGDTDLYISNYRLDRNFFLSNPGDGTFTDIADENGTMGVETWGAYGHTIGSVIGDIDNDGDFDLINANLAHPFYYHFSDKSRVLINDGAGGYTDEADARGLYYRETHSNPTLLDADNDGDLDLFITSVYTGRFSDYYENDGAGVFTLRNYESGLVVTNGWGSAVADHDQDGDLDMVAYDLLRNDLDTGAAWLHVRVVGGIAGGPADRFWQGASNRSAIGAVVEVASDENTQLRHVSGGSGTGVQDSLTQHFGLGDADTGLTVTVFFPGGAEVVLKEIDAGQVLWVHEDGSWQTGPELPLGW